jgi:hypothetical protein
MTYHHKERYKSELTLFSRYSVLSVVAHSVQTLICFAGPNEVRDGNPEGNVP